MTVMLPSWVMFVELPMRRRLSPPHCSSAPAPSRHKKTPPTKSPPNTPSITDPIFSLRINSHKFQIQFQFNSVNPKDSHFARRRAARRKDLVAGNDFQTKRTAPSETDELRNGLKGGRPSAKQKIFIGRNENGKFRASGNFNPSHRQNRRSSARRGFNFPMRDGDDGESSSSLGIVPPCSHAWSGVQISAVAMNSHTASDKTPAAKKICSRVRRLNWNFPGRIYPPIKAPVATKPASQFARSSRLQIAPPQEPAPARCRLRNV